MNYEVRCVLRSSYLVLCLMLQNNWVRTLRLAHHHARFSIFVQIFDNGDEEFCGRAALAGHVA
jgi:hypothetical protein